MQTFDQHLLAHLQAGRITFEDALHVATSPHDFKLMVAAQENGGVRRPPSSVDPDLPGTEAAAPPAPRRAVRAAVAPPRVRPPAPSAAAGGPAGPGRRRPLPAGPAARRPAAAAPRRRRRPRRRRPSY